MILPRLIRMRDAPAYTGFDRNRFNAEVRPYLTSVPMGVQGIAFDRLEIDRWIDQYIQRNGRAPKKGDLTWGAGEHPACERPEEFGTSKKKSQAMASFDAALEQATSKRQKDT